jgi:hypothetical protein
MTSKYVRNAGTTGASGTAGTTPGAAGNPGTAGGPYYLGAGITYSAFTSITFNISGGAGGSGGAGDGSGTGGAGANGGNAGAYVVSSATSESDFATAIGGNGGHAGADGATGTGSANGGAGGSAHASAANLGYFGFQSANAYARASGGSGGYATNHGTGGAAGTASITGVVYAYGNSAQAEAEATGGSGGSGGSFNAGFFGVGEQGASETLDNAVAARTKGGSFATLRLFQYVHGGGGGSGYSIAGAAGNAVGVLGYTDHSNALIFNGTEEVLGGTGGSTTARDLTGMAGGSASGTVAVAGSHRVYANVVSQGGQGGSGGRIYFTDYGTILHVVSGNGGVGGLTYAGATADTSSATEMGKAVANAVGGAGNLGIGAGYAGGAGAAATATASATGDMGFAAAYQTGGQGGIGRYTASGGAGASSTLDNAVQATSQGNQITLDQTATGGAGGYSIGGAGGAAGAAAAILDLTDASGAPRIYVQNQAFGGAGGNSSDKAGQPGGNALDDAFVTGSHAVYVTSVGTGGRGGATGYENQVTQVTREAGSGQIATGGAGGSITGSIDAVSTGGAMAEGVLRLTGGAGGSGQRGQGGTYTGGAGGTASGTVYASGGTAVANLYQAGGAGGGDLSHIAASGGAGAGSTIDNGVSGVADGGNLDLKQFAYGGAGSYSQYGAAGAAGNAVSDLTFNETANPTSAAYSSVQVKATGGAGAVAGHQVGSAGGTANAAATLTTTNGNQIDVTATGGIGGENSVIFQGTAGGSATASGTDTVMNGRADSFVTATGGAGTGSTTGSAAGAPGGVASGATSRAYGSSALAEVNQTGGAGGSSTGTGGAGAGSTIDNAVFGRAAGGGLTLNETATGGAGGYGGTSKLAGNGGNAAAYLSYTAHDTDTNFSGSATAVGGKGGVGTTAGDGGIGGTANASIDLTGAASVTATAHVNAGAPGTNSSVVNQLGTANATASADSTGALAASASADAYAASNYTADLSSQVYAASQGSVGPVGNVSAQADAPTAATTGADSTATVTNHANSALGFNASDGPYAAANGNPGSGAFSALLSANSTVETAFGGSAVVLGVGLEEDQYASIGSGQTATETHAMVETFDFRRADLGGSLVLGFVGTAALGSDFTTLTVMASVGTSQVLDQSFTDKASADAYFTDNAITLGSVASSAIGSIVALGGDLGEVSVTLDVTTNASFAGYGEEFVLAATAACFATGTRVATPGGLVAVERLRPGDSVVTASGRIAPVRWIGFRRVDLRRHPRPLDVMPVVVSAGAFGPFTPSGDLVLSPDHAVFVDGRLIPIRYLINNVSVVQQTREAVTYWHVELDRHDVILAEGMPCESYLDTGNRAAFANAPGAVAMIPDFAGADFARAVWAAGGCAPIVTDPADPWLRWLHTALMARARRAAA